MNAAFKWYSHNSSIIQFYSGYSYTKNTTKPNSDYMGETVEKAYDYSDNFISCCSEINVN